MTWRKRSADADSGIYSGAHIHPGAGQSTCCAGLRGRPTRSIELCEIVVEMKPRHFGAWHGMALCAVKLHQWRRAIEAAREALQIQPQAKANREIIIFARSKLAGC